MKITILGSGTSQGVPVIACNCEVCRSANAKDKRLRASIMIECCGKTIVIDSGPDFRQQMLRENVQTLDAILFTHDHKDHIAGLDDIRAYNYVLQRPMDIYAEPRVHSTLRREYAYVFADFKYPGVPEVTVFDIDNDQAAFSVADIKIMPIRALHLRLPVLGFRIGGFAYITDANYIAPAELEKLKGLDVLVLGALRKEKHLSHFNLEGALEVVQQLKPRRTWFTHISHQMGLHTEVNNELPTQVQLAYDGLTIECC